MLAKKKIATMECDMNESFYFSAQNKHQKIPEYPFVHSFKLLPHLVDEEMEQSDFFEKVLQLYQDSLEECGILDGDQITTNYNLLMTDKFLLVVPRKQEMILNRFSVNALFFLGSFICKNKNDLEYLNQFYFEDIYQDAVFSCAQELQTYVSE